MTLADDLATTDVVAPPRGATLVDYGNGARYDRGLPLATTRLPWIDPASANRLRVGLTNLGLWESL